MSSDQEQFQPITDHERKVAAFTFGGGAVFLGVKGLFQSDLAQNLANNTRNIISPGRYYYNGGFRETQASSNHAAPTHSFAHDAGAEAGLILGLPLAAAVAMTSISSAVRYRLFRRDQRETAAAEHEAIEFQVAEFRMLVDSTVETYTVPRPNFQDRD